MRQYRHAVTAMAVAFIVSVTGLAVFMKHRQQTYSQTVSISEQVKTNEIRQWQNEIRTWQEEEKKQTQAQMTKEQSDFVRQGIKSLPDTGPGETLAFTGIISLISYVVHYRLQGKVKS